MAIGLNNSGSGSITLKAADDCKYTLVFPNRPGDVGEVLTNTGSGQLVWKKGVFSDVSDASATSNQFNAVVWKWTIGNADNGFTITEQDPTFKQDKNQALVKIGTLPGSTIDPFQVHVRGEKTFTIHHDGLVSLRLDRPFYVGNFGESDLNSTASELLQVFGSAKFNGEGTIKLPTGACSEGAEGQIRFNVQSQEFEGFAKEKWNSFVVKVPYETTPPFKETTEGDFTVVQFDIEHCDMFEYNLLAGKVTLDFTKPRSEKKRVNIKIAHELDGLMVQWKSKIFWEDKRAPIFLKLPSITIVTLQTYDHGDTWYGSFSRY